jgi:hypothetical protein
MVSRAKGRPNIDGVSEEYAEKNFGFKKSESVRKFKRMIQ